MVNEYYYNGIKVVDIVKQPSFNGSKIYSWKFILENGEDINAKNTSVIIKCTDCGKSVVIKWAVRYEDKKYLCNHCRLMGTRNPFYGKRHSEKFKKKLSEDRLGKWCVGKNNPMYGKNIKDYMSEEEYLAHNKKISIANSGKNNPMYGKKVSDFLTDDELDNWKSNIRNSIISLYKSEIGDFLRKHQSIKQHELQSKNPEYYHKIKANAGRSGCIEQLKHKKNLIESKVENWLKEHNLKYDYSCIMGSDDRCFQYDFIIHGKRILIEVQGDYWHGNPIKYNIDGSNGKIKLNEAQLKDIKRDEEKKRFAIAHGFKIIYIWENEIMKDDFSVLMEIIK